jgi:hypothetical protein
LVVLTSPNNNSTYSAPANLTLAASVTPNGHTISKVQFFNGAALLGETLTSPYSVPWVNVGAGNYNLTASAIYDSNSTVSTPVTTVSITNPVASSISIAVAAGTISSPFVVSNGLALQTVETGISGAGRAVYNFNVPFTGDYLVSAIVIAPNNGANSFYVNIDADPTDPVMIWDLALTTTPTSETVCWRGNVNSSGVPGADQFSPKVFNLAQGPHQLIILGREANTQLGAITISPANVLPAPWQVLDIGNPGITASASVSNGGFSVFASGTLSGASDSFRFLYQPMTGDGDLRARITSLQNTTSNACAGVMVRETLAPGSRYAFLGALPDGTVRTQNRTSIATGSSAANAGSLALPNAWARLVRSNNSVLAYKSSDGASWTLIGSNSIAMATNIYFGLAVASGTSNALSGVTLTNVVAVPSRGYSRLVPTNRSETDKRMSIPIALGQSPKALPPRVRGEAKSSAFRATGAGNWISAITLSAVTLVIFRLLVGQKAAETISASTNDLVSEASADSARSKQLPETPQTDLLSDLCGLEQESDPTVKERMFARVVSSIGVDRTPLALEQLLSISTPAAIELRDRLVRHWAEVDPAQAAKWSAGVADSTTRSAVMTQAAIAWANSDIKAATGWITSLPMDQPTPDATIALSYEVARTDPLIALETAGRLAPSHERDEALVFALNQWVATDVAGARHWAFSLPPSDLRQRLIAALSTTGAQGNAQAAAELAATQLDPGADQDRAAVSIVQQWAQSAPEAAAAWVEQFPEGNLRTSAAENLASIWTIQDPQTATHWIDALPQALFARLLSGAQRRLFPKV